MTTARRNRTGRPTADRSGSVRSLRPDPPVVAPAGPTKGVDYIFILALVALISFGAVMVYSATAVGSEFKDTGKMLMWIALGTVGLCLGAALPLKFWKTVAPIGLVGSGAALLALKFLPESIAPTINGAVRWIFLPGGFSVQPSEFAKLAMVLFSAQYLEHRAPKMGFGRGSGKHWFRYLLVLGIIAGLIYKEPDLGTTLVLTGTAFCMLIVSGVNWKPLALGLVGGALVVGLLAWNTDHQRERLESWLNPWHEDLRMKGGWQTIQSWMALARGGTEGVGLGQSLQKQHYLPEAETDFIFAVVAEELGLYRSLIVLMVFGLLAWRGYEIAAQAPDRYQALLATGVTSWIALQCCLNLGVVTGTVPNTGVPLPFISSGGSSTVALMTATGILIGVSRRRLLNPAEETPQAGVIEHDDAATASARRRRRR